MREIVFDTETTGFEPLEGHRVIEIGCVEIVNRMRTGRTFQTYLNPERDVPDEAFRVHGISTDFLKDKPKFSEVAHKFLDFIGDDKLVIHNASFDIKFINYELNLVKQASLPMDRAIDTLLIARKKFPGSPASLDALCKRFNVDLSGRDKHGALLDSILLSDVYAELMGGKQVTFDLAGNKAANEAHAKIEIKHRPALAVTKEEEEAHKEFMKKIKNPAWAE